MLKSPVAVATIVVVFLVAVAGLWYIAHTHAEPGTPISLVGVVKYQKVKTPEKPPETPAPNVSLQAADISSLTSRLGASEKERTQAQAASATQIDKLTKDVLDREKQLNELRNALPKPAPGPSVPALHIYMFKWLLSDDKCKVRASVAIREAGGGNVWMDNFATMGSKNQNRITVLCNSPHYAVDVAGADGDVTKDLRDAVAAVMTK